MTRYIYGPSGKTSATGAASRNPFQFTGRENDGNDLYYHRARYYNPRLQRFFREDPLDLSEVILRGQAGQTYVSDSQDVYLLRSTLLSNPQFLNRYAYALNNPVNFTDPTGEIVPQVIGCALGSGISIVADVLAGRKVNLFDAGLGCTLGAVGGSRVIFPRLQGTGRSDAIIKWPGGYKTRFDITDSRPHNYPHVHWWTKK